MNEQARESILMAGCFRGLLQMKVAFFNFRKCIATSVLGYFVQLVLLK